MLVRSEVPTAEQWVRPGSKVGAINSRFVGIAAQKCCRGPNVSDHGGLCVVVAYASQLGAFSDRGAAQGEDAVLRLIIARRFTGLAGHKEQSRLGVSGRLQHRLRNRKLRRGDLQGLPNFRRLPGRDCAFTSNRVLVGAGIRISTSCDEEQREKSNESSCVPPLGLGGRLRLCAQMEHWDAKYPKPSARIRPLSRGILFSLAPLRRKLPYIWNVLVRSHGFDVPDIAKETGVGMRRHLLGFALAIGLSSGMVPTGLGSGSRTHKTSPALKSAPRSSSSATV